MDFTNLLKKSAYLSPLNILNKKYEGDYKMNITVWNEYRHEKKNQLLNELYSKGIHDLLAYFLAKDVHKVHTATLYEVKHGLTNDVLNNTDVLLWWGHKAHEEVSDTVVQKVQKRVLEGMG